MRRTGFIVTAAILAASALPATADIVGSFLMEDNIPNVTGLQSTSHVTRVSTGNTATRGAVQGDVNIMGGYEVGVEPANYTGFTLNIWSMNTQYNNLNRYGDTDGGTLITWDFDLSSYLSGKTVGGAGNSGFTIDLDQDITREGASLGLWFISYTGDGLTRDTTDVTTHTVSLDASGQSNFALISDGSAYKQIMALNQDGMYSVDITPEMSAIQAGDGQIRVAYLDQNFYRNVLLQTNSGINEYIVVPEPSSLALLGLSGALLLMARRRR